MALFQISVLNKYLKLQDQHVIDKAYKKFAAYFHNRERQQNIRESKEEQFQEGFLRELFVNVLGYSLNPEPGFNLTTEFKNEKGGKKADGAILKDGQAIAVIELKSTKTKDLESIRQQAFDYKANQTGCVYVITSNFEKLRFYINNAVDFEEFNLFNLTIEQFALLFLCLDQSNVFKNIPLEIKNDSIREEENITKKFYAAYSIFKRELFRDLVKQNVSNEVFKAELQKEDAERANKNIKLTLFKKSQKLIDRFLFIYFGEDRNLLPPNSTIKILQDWDKLKDLDAIVPLYDRFKLYFKYLDIGRKGTDKKAEIFAYNGGLFKPDPVLDSLIISDELLYKHAKELSHYNFDSQIDVNILGHIFENSLNEIESVNAEIEGTEFDKQTTKRKKDGVFYTPKYITKYIVDNTVGKLCEEKKAELKINIEDFNPKRQKETKKKLLSTLEEYRNWLLQLTILDPACGSGAFLNQALDFLITEHRYIDELKAALLGASIVFQDIENTILENNIFGVDLNEESIEIAKLSLWLRTAQPRRKLTTLSSNIKCGNSLIDSKEIAGDKAFNWEVEFPEVFTKGGFDVVIGNPPYVQSHSISEKEKEFFHNYYITSEYQINTYSLFAEKTFKLLKEGAQYSLIIPNYWLSTKNDSNLRKLLFLTNHVSILLNTFQVFDSATVDTLILVGEKQEPTFPKCSKIISISNSHKSILNRLNAISLKDWEYQKTLKFSSIDDDIVINIQRGIDINGEHTLGDFFTFKFGIKPYQIGKGKPPQTIIEKTEKKFHSNQRLDDSYQKLIGASDLRRYYIDWKGEFIKYGEFLAEPRDISLFSSPRILLNRIISKRHFNATYTEEVLICNSDLITLSPKIKDEKFVIFYLGIITSKLCAAYIRSININLNRQAFPKINTSTLVSFPIPKFDKDSKIIELVKSTLIESINLNKLLKKFINYLQSQFQIKSLTNKLKNWHELEFSEFIKELNKAIKKVGGEKLSKSDEMEWMEVFESKKSEAQTLKTEIDKTDHEIDKMVYELYGLSEEEIKIVEG